MRAKYRHRQRRDHARCVLAHDTAGAAVQQVVNVDAAFYDRNTLVVLQVQVIEYAAQRYGLDTLNVRDQFRDATAHQPVRHADR